MDDPNLHSQKLDVCDDKMHLAQGKNNVRQRASSVRTGILTLHIRIFSLLWLANRQRTFEAFTANNMTPSGNQQTYYSTMYSIWNNP